MASTINTAPRSRACSTVAHATKPWSTRCRVGEASDTAITPASKPSNVAGILVRRRRFRQRNWKPQLLTRFDAFPQTMVLCRKYYANPVSRLEPASKNCSWLHCASVYHHLRLIKISSSDTVWVRILRIKLSLRSIVRAVRPHFAAISLLVKPSSFHCVRRTSSSLANARIQ